jgi:hypothetical protein
MNDILTEFVCGDVAQIICGYIGCLDCNFVDSVLEKFMLLDDMLFTLNDSYITHDLSVIMLSTHIMLEYDLVEWGRHSEPNNIDMFYLKDVSFRQFIYATAHHKKLSVLLQGGTFVIPEKHTTTALKDCCDYESADLLGIFIYGKFHDIGRNQLLKKINPAREFN